MVVVALVIKMEQLEYNLRQQYEKYVWKNTETEDLKQDKK